MRAVKANYSAIVAAVEHIYSYSHKPEVLCIKGVLCKKSIVATMYLLDYIHPQVASYM